ncbi:MAG: arsenate reductase/protein-tyrosine-phosphatase family protein [Actinomycetota bacterium]
MRRYLFVCVHNAGRSVMAEAFTNALGEGRAIRDEIRARVEALLLEA